MLVLLLGMIAPALLIPKKLLTVCIDPGHPSEVGSGTHGRDVSEVHLAWQIAQRVRIVLERKHIKVVFTKTTEQQMVTNRRRAEIANNAHADLWIRLHCDASHGSGYTTYYPDRQGKQRSVVGPPRSLLKEEANIAHRFHFALHKGLDGLLADNGLKPDLMSEVGSKYGVLVGSLYTNVPVVLVEMCVLTNLHDEKLMMSEYGQVTMATAIGEASVAAITR